MVTAACLRPGSALRVASSRSSMMIRWPTSSSTERITVWQLHNSCRKGNMWRLWLVPYEGRTEGSNTTTAADIIASKCWFYLCFILCSQLSFEGGEQGRQDDPQVACQSISSHSGQEGQHTCVHGRSSQLVWSETTSSLVKYRQNNKAWKKKIWLWHFTFGTK